MNKKIVSLFITMIVLNFPVMVVSINERTDDQGNLTFGRNNAGLLKSGNPMDRANCPPPPEGCGGGGGGGGGSPPPHPQGAMEFFEKIYLLNDNEAWLLGDPEIYVVTAGEIKCNEDPCWTLEADYPDVNNENQLYTLHNDLFNWYTNLSGNYMVVAVIESDIGGGWDVTFPWEPRVITVHWGDDMVGYWHVQFSDVPKEYAGIGQDARIWMDY